MSITIDNIPIACYIKYLNSVCHSSEKIQKQLFSTTAARRLNGRQTVFLLLFAMCLLRLLIYNIHVLIVSNNFSFFCWVCRVTSLNCVSFILNSTNSLIIFLYRLCVDILLNSKKFVFNSD